MKNFKLGKGILKISFLFFILFFSECEKFPDLPDVGECDIYHIKETQHYAEGFNPERLEVFRIPRCDSKISFTFTANETMFYDPEIPRFVNGHNKIRGLVCGNKNDILAKNILNYSARITWHCSNSNQLDIGLIVHLPVLENHIQEILLEEVQEGDEIFCTIEDLGFEGFYFYVQNLNTLEFAEKIISKYGAHDTEIYGLLEAPYFGGHELAPHDIFIEICTN